MKITSAGENVKAQLLVWIGDVKHVWRVAVAVAAAVAGAVCGPVFKWEHVVWALLPGVCEVVVLLV